MLCPKHLKIGWECHPVHGKPGVRSILWSKFFYCFPFHKLAMVCGPQSSNSALICLHGWERVWKVWKPDPTQSMKRLLSVNLTTSDSLIADWKIFIRHTPSPFYRNKQFETKLKSKVESIPISKYCCLLHVKVFISLWQNIC